MHPWLFSIPVVSAILGLLVNRAWGFYFLNSYLPRQKQLLATAISKKANDFIPIAALQAKISNPELVEKAMPMIEAHIDEFLNVKLQKEIPMLSMFIGNKTTDKVKEVFLVQVKTLFPKVMDHMLNEVKETPDIEQSLYKKLSALNITEVLKPQLVTPLNRWYYSGLLGGFIIGVMDLLIFYFAS